MWLCNNIDKYEMCAHGVKRAYFFHVLSYSIVLIVMSSLLFVFFILWIRQREGPCIFFLYFSMKNLHPLAKAVIRERPCNIFLFFCLYFLMKNLHPLAKAVIRERPCNHCYTITNTIVCLPHKLPLLHCLRIFSFFGVFFFFHLMFVFVTNTIVFVA